MAATKPAAPSVKGALLVELGARETGLCIGGVSAESIAEAFGTPAYVFDAAILRRNLAAVMGALGPRVEVLFALKANPNAAVARVLRLAGAGSEVASSGEIHVALRAGFRGDAIQFAGPGKHGDDLRMALHHRIGALNIESAAEYEAIADLARKMGVRPAIAIRLNPRESVGGARMHMGGGSKKFGVDMDGVPALVRRVRDENVCKLRGLHVYAGTQNFDARAWVENAKALVVFAAEVEREVGIEFETLNFGGGLGVPLFEGDAPLDLALLGAGVRELVAADARPRRRYFVEIGRYLATTAGVYLTRVVYVKESAGRRHLILDGGMHHHAAAAGIGSVIRRPFPTVLARTPLSAPAEKYTLGGPLCTPADEFAANLNLPDVRQGDLIAILASGAYGLTFSNVMFLSHPSPSEVLVDGGRPMLVREKGTPEDALRGQIVPSDDGGA